jgi:Ca-activated chloride channel family protein
MHTKYLLAGLASAGLALILTLSSFYKPLPPQTPLPQQEEVSYNGNRKVINSTGPLTLSTDFENNYYTTNHPEGFFYAELSAQEVHSEYSTEVPLNISVVIDRSGSMSGDKLINAKRAAKHLIDQLNPNDYVSIVMYDDRVNLVHPTTVAVNRHLIKSKIDAITTRGGTNLMGGAQLGYDEVKRNYKEGYINRVLLLSDGLANEGITDPQQIQKIVRTQNNTNGISISTFGLGNDYNEDLMTAMAENGTGNYYFISNPQSIAGIFERELNGLKEVVAQNAKVTITLPENVNVTRVYGHPFDQVGRKLTVHLRDIFSGEQKGILVRYAVARGVNTLLRFSTAVDFTDRSESQRSRSFRNNNNQEFTNRIDVYQQSFNEWVSAQVALYTSNERLELAMKEVDKGNYDEAKKIVRENNEYIQSKAPLVSKSVELQKAQTTNAGYSKDLESLSSMSQEDVKYLQKSTKSTNYEIRAKKKR